MYMYMHEDSVTIVTKISEIVMFLTLFNDWIKKIIIIIMQSLPKFGLIIPEMTRLTLIILNYYLLITLLIKVTPTV